MPIYMMLVGVPAAGKSYFVAHRLPLLYPEQEWHVISSDNLIESLARSQNKTYNEIWKTDINWATKEMNRQLQECFLNRQNIVLDQTNTSVNTRAKKLAGVPKAYEKIAVFFPTPEPQEHAARLASRPGKSIPEHVVNDMAQKLVLPTVEEGFDSVIIFE